MTSALVGASLPFILRILRFKTLLLLSVATNANSEIASLAIDVSILSWLSCESRLKIDECVPDSCVGEKFSTDVSNTSEPEGNDSAIEPVNA